MNMSLKNTQEENTNLINEIKRLSTTCDQLIKGNKIKKKVK